jgi:hypothetical protein
MPDRKRKKASETEAARSKKPPRASQAKAIKPSKADKATQPATAAKGRSRVRESVATGKAGSRTDRPRLVARDGEVYLEECDIPIWRLEMARRAGSSPAAMIAASPGLTPQGLDLAFAYARRHKAEFDPLIQRHSGNDVPPEDEGDEDEAAFEADLEALLETDAELFRRLAQ